MDLPVPRLQDETYVNWEHASLGLLYLKDGLEGFIDKRVWEFHETLRFRVHESYSRHNPIGRIHSPQICSKCSHSDVQKSLQGEWLKEIISFHMDSANCNIARRSSLQPQLWSSYPWEVAKCYLPTGYEDVASAVDVDVGAMLTVLSTCTFMWRFVTKHRVVEQVLDIRNRLMLSNDLTVSDDQLKDDTDKMVELLTCLAYLSPTEPETFERTINNISELSAKTMDMSHRMELAALNSKRQAMDRELVNLRDKCSDFELTDQDLTTTAASMALNENYQKLKAARSRFDEFLRSNELVEDMAKLTRTVEEQNQMLEHGLANVDVPVTRRIKSWEEQCRDIQRHLIDLYQNRCSWENPMTLYGEQFPPMYVQPAVKRIRQQDIHLSMMTVKQQQSQLTYKQIFFSKIERSKNIYITGDAGAGKTMFCNQMVLNWCTAVENIRDGHDSSEDLKILSTFRFLFYIHLKDANEEYHVKDMIKEQLLHMISPPIDVEALLKSESCLIILDGLDQWTRPAGVRKSPHINKELPDRNTMNRTCVFLSTVQNWKFDIMHVRNGEIDKHVELSGIDEDSSKTLAKKMLDYLNRKTLAPKTVNDFYTEIDKKSLGTFITLPVLLIHFISMWHFGKEFSHSQVQLYCSMLEWLFERSDKNIPQETSEKKSRDLPDCFSTKYYCQSRADILHCLAQLAYKALFNKQEEEALVFKSTRMEIYGISATDIRLCLQSGILSQTKDYHNYTGRFKKYSFLHKKFQEFLAALYISTCEPVENLIEFCSTLDVMLEMSQVWQFVAGLSPDITKQVLEHLKHVLTEDKQVLKYRRTLEGQCLIRDIQTCITDCVIEGRYNSYIYDICLEDFYITKETVGPVEHFLSCTQSSKVKSVYMNTAGIDSEHLASITSHLQKCRSIQKLHLTDPRSRIPNRKVADIVVGNCDTLTCLNLYSDITATDKLITAICSSSSKHLVALRLFNVKLTHKQKEHIIKKLSKSSTLRQSVLAFQCTGHGIQCRAKIDLSTMAQVRTLELWGMSLDNLQSLSHTVEKVVLWHVTLPVTALLQFVRNISQTKQDITVSLGSVTVTEVIEKEVDLESVLRACFGPRLTVCLYDDSKYTWCIDFHTSSQ